MRAAASAGRPRRKKMKSNADIVRAVLEQVVNRKDIGAWDRFFSPDYVARGAPFIGMGFSRDTSSNRHVVDAVLPGSPAEGKLRVGDEIVWIQGDGPRRTTFGGIGQVIQRNRGDTLRMGLRRGRETLDVELTRGRIPGFDTGCGQAKSEMLEFMTNEVPDLRVEIETVLEDGDRAACLMEYRGTHATHGREAVWREIWVVRIAGGKIVESWPLPDVDAYLRQLGYRSVPPKP